MNLKFQIIKNIIIIINIIHYIVFMQNEIIFIISGFDRDARNIVIKKVIFIKFFQQINKIYI